MRPFESDPAAAMLLRRAAAGLLAVALVLSSCGEKKREAELVAARVDGEEITAQQINAVLQARSVRPEQADAAGRQVLERLIDQQLAVRKAIELELDREPRVEQQLEAARREVLARAYLERVGEAAARPSAEEIDAYYQDKPALFADRRVYTLQEISIEATPEQLPALRDQLAARRQVDDFVAWLKASGFRYTGTQAVRGAEQLPLAGLDTIARMKEGQALLVPTPGGVQVVVLAGSRPQPVTLEQARPAIEQFILNERRRQRIEGEVRALREAATIEYVGRFGEATRPGAPRPAASAGSAASPAASGGASPPPAAASAAAGPDGAQK